MKVDKTTLRSQYLQKRRALSTPEQQQKSETLCHIATTLPIIQNSQHIGLYWPFDGEISPLPLVTHPVLQKSKEYYLPFLGNETQSLIFNPYKSGDQRLKNKFGFYQNFFEGQRVVGADRCVRPVNANDLDLILLPLVAFDRQGHRLGRGKGHYDRTLAFRKQQTSPQKPFLLGLGYAFQEIPHLPNDPWDIPLDGVLTEQGYINFKSYCHL